MGGLAPPVSQVLNYSYLSIKVRNWKIWENFFVINYIFHMHNLQLLGNVCGIFTITIISNVSEVTHSMNAYFSGVKAVKCM